MEAITNVSVSTIDHSTVRAQAPWARARRERPAATHADTLRSPLIGQTSAARDLLATSWGWS